jgi:hypothetical protein
MDDTTNPRLGDAKTVAILLGTSVKTVRRQCDLRKLPGVIRIGRLLRFDLDLIGRWLDEGAPPLSRFDAKGVRHT